MLPQPVVGAVDGIGAGFDTLLSPENCCAVGAVSALGLDSGTELLLVVCGPRVMLLGPFVASPPDGVNLSVAKPGGGPRMLFGLLLIGLFGSIMLSCVTAGYAG